MELAPRMLNSCMSTVSIFWKDGTENAILMDSSLIISEKPDIKMAAYRRQAPIELQKAILEAAR